MHQTLDLKFSLLAYLRQGTVKEAKHLYQHENPVCPQTPLVSLDRRLGSMIEVCHSRRVRERFGLNSKVSATINRMVKGKGLQTVVLGFGDGKRRKVIALKKKTSG